MACLKPSCRVVAIWSAVALALAAIVALSGRQVAAMDDARCQIAMQLQADPTVAAFKECASTTPIPPACCLKMAPFVPYGDCLQVPQYKAIADSFLAPAVTVDRALDECLGG